MEYAKINIHGKDELYAYGYFIDIMGCTLLEINQVLNLKNS